MAGRLVLAVSWECSQDLVSLGFFHGVMLWSLEAWAQAGTELLLPYSAGQVVTEPT